MINGRTEYFPLQFRNKIGVSAFTSSIQHCTGDHSQCSKTRGKWLKVWKGRRKSLSFPDNRIIHMRSPLKCTNKLLKIRRPYMTVIEYKLKIKKAIS